MRAESSPTQIQAKTVRRLLCAGAGLYAFLLANPSPSVAATTVTFTGTTPQKAKLQTDFLAFTTTYWISTVSPGSFTGDFKIVVSSRNAVAVVVSSSIATGTAFHECLATGFAFGMDMERKDNIKLITGLKDDMLITDTCGGLTYGTTEQIETYVAFMLGCNMGYNIVASTISQRDGKPWVPVP